MFKLAVLYTKTDWKIKIEQLQEDHFCAEIEKHLANKDGPYYSLDNNGPFSTLFRTEKETTRTLLHSEKAVKAACQKMLALAFHFSVPSLMFTIILPGSLFY